MKVLILAGGKGTRMDEETEIRPKPLVDIGGKPILWHIMSIYANSGFKEFVVLTGYKGHQIREHFESNPENDWIIDFIDTGLDTSKAMRIKKAQNLVSEDDFFVAYGDDLSDISPRDIYDFHKKHKNIVTLAAMPLESNFGVVEIDENNTVKQFREKPRIEGHWINGGFFCFKREIFDLLNENEELEDQVFIRLAKEGQIKAFKHYGFWKCMNTKKESIEFNNMYSKNKAPWVKW